MSKTKAQLEEEVESLRAVLAAIGEGLPPLPEDPEKMKLYGLECASRLSSVTVYAAGVADCTEDHLAAYAQGTVADLRGRWARPLHYQPETPDFNEAAAILAKAIEDGTPVIVEDDAVAFGPYCTAGYEPIPGHKLLCEEKQGHDGLHRSLGYRDGDPDITWTGEHAPAGAA